MSPEITSWATSFSGCINIFFDPSLNQTVLIAAEK
jgi:hypothetical protein